jgi:hypothetical protein
MINNQYWSRTMITNDTNTRLPRKQASFSEAEKQRANRYFLLHLYRDGQKVPVIIWNRVKGYANIVPDYLITNEPAFAAKENLGIVQVSRPFGARRSARRLVSTLPFDAIVLWTCDTLTYDSAVAEFRAFAVANLDDGGCTP